MAKMKFIIMKMIVLLKTLNNFNSANFLVLKRLRVFNVFFVRKLYGNYWFSKFFFAGVCSYIKSSGGTVFCFFIWWR